MLPLQILSVLGILLVTFLVFSVPRYFVGRRRDPASRSSAPAALCVASGGLTFALFVFSGNAYAALGCGSLLVLIGILQLSWPKRRTGLGYMGLAIALAANAGVVTVGYRTLLEARAELRAMEANPFTQWCRHPPPRTIVTEASMGCVGPALASMGLERRIKDWPYLCGTASLALLFALVQVGFVLRGVGDVETETALDSPGKN